MSTTDEEARRTELVEMARTVVDTFATRPGRITEEALTSLSAAIEAYQDACRTTNGD